MNIKLRLSSVAKGAFVGLICFLGLSFLLLPSPARAKEPKNGYELAKFVYDRNVGEDSEAWATMSLVDRRGKERKRQMYIATRDEGKILKTLIVFLSPKDIAGTGFLSLAKDNGQEEQFLYLPALRRSRRIAGSFRFQRFVGSDFTYEDMERHHPDRYEHQILGKDIYLKASCWILESRPKKKKDSKYSRFVQWITQEGFLPVRVEYYDKKGRLWKVYEALSFEEIQGIWTVLKAEMKDLKKDHRTLIEVEKIRYNVGLKSNLFSVRSLEMGLKLVKRRP